MLALLAFAAHAATNEVSFDLGWVGASDPAWDFFSDADTLPSYGVRLGYAVHPNVAVIAGWQHAVNGASVGLPGLAGSSDYEYDDYDDGHVTAAMYSDQILLGAKGDVKIWSWLHPYATVQAVGMRGLVRMDDDPGDDENLTQVQVAGVTGGVEGALGLDFLIPVKGRWKIGLYTELGYGWLAPMRLEDLGSVQFAGFAGRAGVGVRF
jgi:hypothetical protein